MRYRSALKVPLLLLLCLSCGKAIPHLEGIDLDQWKDDRNGCNGYRSSVSTTLNTEIPKVKGLSEMDIIGLFGKPDQNELYKRNQKFYCYFLSRGPMCEKADSLPNKLILRFNAMGYAQQVSVAHTSG